MSGGEAIGALIPVRLASERLPGKALLDICGKPAICHLLDRIFATRYVDPANVVVCTTEDASDDSLVTVVEDYGGRIFRGSTDDIVRRMRDAAHEFAFDHILQVDGDDILCDTLYMDLVLDRLLEDSGIDIVTCTGLPLGVASKSFTAKALDRVFEHYRTEENDTGFTYFFTKTGLFREEVIRPEDESHVLDEARLTLDYEVDLEVFRRIFEALYAPGTVIGIAEITGLLKEKPEIMAINAGLEDEYWARTRDKAQLEYQDADGRIKRILV